MIRIFDWLVCGIFFVVVVVGFILSLFGLILLLLILLAVWIIDCVN